LNEHDVTKVLGPFFGDLDNDGDQDLFTAITTGSFGLTDKGFDYWENIGSASDPLFSEPIRGGLVNLSINWLIKKAELYNSNGGLVQVFKDPRQSINLGTVEKGLYILVLCSEDQRRHNTKLMRF